MSKEILNSSHRAEYEQGGYFEWWYFHFVSEAGVNVNTVVHETDIFGLKREPFTSLTLLAESDRPEYYRRSLAESSISLAGKFLKVKETIEENDRGLSFSWIFPSGISFVGQIQKATEQLTINNSILYEAGGKKSYWLVQIPFAPFTGELEYQGKSREISGFAYQDHQWGDLRMQDFASDWIWGHFVGSEEKALFFKIKTQDGEIVDRWAIINRGTSTQTGMEMPKSKSLLKLSDLQNPTSASLDQALVLPNGKRLTFSLQPGKIMRSRDEKHRDFSFMYIRWSADGSLNSKPVAGITEYLRIRK